MNGPFGNSIYGWPLGGQMDQKVRDGTFFVSYQTRRNFCHLQSLLVGAERHFLMIQELWLLN